MHQRAAPGDRADGQTVIRWECRCQRTPVLLGTYEPGGKIHVKVRDRYWHILGRVWTTCPRCGTEHTLEPLAGEPAPPAVPPSTVSAAS
jgi:hypothetical protein